MNQTVINILIALVIAVGVGTLVYVQKQTLPDTGTGATTTDTTITLEEITAHNTRESCWTMINGSAYDLTSWIPNHPGGEQAILQLCGTDGSAKFNGQHGGSAQQEAVLTGFKISGGNESTNVSASTSAPVIINDDDGTPDQGKNRRGRDDDDD